MNMVLDWNDEQDKLVISEELMEKLQFILKEAAVMEGVEEGEVALTFVDDERIHELNLEYRGIDRPTDVLSFALTSRRMKS